MKHCKLEEEEEKETYYFHIFQSGDLILQEKYMVTQVDMYLLIPMAMSLKISTSYPHLVKSNCVWASNFDLGHLVSIAHKKEKNLLLLRKIK